MNRQQTDNRPRYRCAIYTRKSTEEGLDQAFNSLDAQREACEAYIKSQTHEGWVALPDAFDDGGYSGGTIERPALTRLLEAIQASRVDIIVVYKVDRLSRSLADFVRLVEQFDQYGVSFVSVTQQFNTSNSMGRLTLNVLLSFAQFEREVTSERIRDKIAASKKKGMWMGGAVPLGYNRVDKQLVIDAEEADTVRHIYDRYLALGCVRALKGELDGDGYQSKSRAGSHASGVKFSRGALYTILRNPVYAGMVKHHDKIYPGQHEAILDATLWDRVQKQLAANRHAKRTRENTKTQSLLAGFVFDDRGNVMSATQSHKGPRRYRYYISQALLQYREDEAGSVVRLPATQLEELVIDALLELFGDGVRLLDALVTPSMSAAQQDRLVRAGQELADAWPSLSLPQRIESIRAWQPSVTVGQRQIAVEIVRQYLLRTLLPKDRPSDKDDKTLVRLDIPVQLKRSGVETRLVLANGDPIPLRRESTVTLQRALQKALMWNEQLLSGKAKTMAAVAKKEGVTQRFIANRIQLAYLAPDIMRRIIAGDVPDTLNLEAFKNCRIPLDWREQRRYFQLAS